MNGWITVFLATNLHHAEVSAEKRLAYREQLPTHIAKLKSAGVPVAVSMHRMHMIEAGMKPEDFDGLELADTTFSHFLPPLWDDTDEGKRQYRSGIENGSALWFSPEYMPSNIPFHIPHRDYIIPIVGPNSYLYSELREDDPTSSAAVAQYEAIRFNGNVLVPMSETIGLRKAFHQFVAIPTRENCLQVVAEMRALIKDGTGRTHIWGMDFEAPIVGGFHGFELWDQLFDEIKKSDVADRFITFAAAADGFRSQAIKVPHTKFARNLGLKWTKYAQQLRHIVRAAEAPTPTTRFDQLLMSLVISSDVLAVMNREIGEAFEREALRPDGTMGKVLITTDPTIKRIGQAALKVYSRDDYSPQKALDVLRKLDDVTPAGQAYASTLADLLERYL